MKRIAIALNAVLAGIIVIQACNPNNTSQNAATQIDTCRAIHCKPYDDTQLQGMITFNVLASMSDAYYRDACKSFISIPDEVVSGGVNTARITTKRDAMSMVFDLEKLKTLIWQMETYTCTHHCDTKMVTGIRFYYVKYPKLGDDNTPLCLQGISETESNKHALVMVPVYWNQANKEWRDFNIWSKDPYKCFVPFGALDTVGVGGLFRMGDPNSGDNHGGVGPPPDPGTFDGNP